MSSKSYAWLHKKLKDLIAQGADVCNPYAGTDEAVIHEWLKQAASCLVLLESLAPTLNADFRSILPRVKFKVDEDSDVGSKSAFHPTLIDKATGQSCEADFLVDFRFDYLKKISAILWLAAKKLELEGHTYTATSLPSIPESLPVKLREQIATLLVGYKSGVRGPASEIVRHLVITVVANQAGHAWRTNVGVICEQLDHYGIPAPGYREHDKQAPQDWVSAFQSDPKRVRDAIRKSFPVCQSYLKAQFAKTFPNLSKPGAT